MKRQCILLIHPDSIQGMRFARALETMGVCPPLTTDDPKEIPKPLSDAGYSLVLYAMKDQHQHVSPEDFELLAHLSDRYNASLIFFAQENYSNDDLGFHHIQLGPSDEETNILSAMEGILHIYNPKKDEIIKKLSNLEFFQLLPRHVIHSLLESGKLVHCPGQKTIFGKGLHRHHFFIMIKGSAQVFLEDKQVGSLSAGDCFGEMSLITPKDPGSVTIRTIDETMILMFPHGFLEELTETEQLEVNKSIMNALVKKLKKAHQFINQNLK